MSKRYIITAEQISEIKKARKLNKDKNAEKRLEVLEMRGDGNKDGVIAKKTGFHPSYVSQLVVKFVTEGIEAIVGKKREANNRNMSFEEETEFLEKFKGVSQKGQVITAKEIRAAYEEKIGHTCGNGQIYRLLARHDCRKIKPRGKHEKKASDEAIEASKKLTLGWKS